MAPQNRGMVLAWEQAVNARISRLRPARAWFSRSGWNWPRAAWWPRCGPASKDNPANGPAPGFDAMPAAVVAPADMTDAPSAYSPARCRMTSLRPCARRGKTGCAHPAHSCDRRPRRIHGSVAKRSCMDAVRGSRAAESASGKRATKANRGTRYGRAAGSAAGVRFPPAPLAAASVPAVS